MVTRMRFTANQLHAIRPQRRHAIERNIVAKAVTHRDIADLEAQLLGQLTGQRVTLGLAGRHLTAGQLPTASQLRRPDTLRHQEH